MSKRKNNIELVKESDSKPFDATPYLFISVDPNDHMLSYHAYYPTPSDPPEGLELAKFFVDVQSDEHLDKDSNPAKAVDTFRCLEALFDTSYKSIYYSSDFEAFKKLSEISGIKFVGKNSPEKEIGESNRPNINGENWNWNARPKNLMAIKQGVYVIPVDSYYVK